MIEKLQNMFDILSPTLTTPLISSLLPSQTTSFSFSHSLSKKKNKHTGKTITEQKNENQNRKTKENQVREKNTHCKKYGKKHTRTQEACSIPYYY